jgi:hypothetical protein
MLDQVSHMFAKLRSSTAMYPYWICLPTQRQLQAKTAKDPDCARLALAQKQRKNSAVENWIDRPCEGYTSYLII